MNFLLNTVRTAEVRRLVTCRLQKLLNWIKKQAQDYMFFTFLQLKKLSFFPIKFLSKKNKSQLKCVCIICGLRMKIMQKRETLLNGIRLLDRKRKRLNSSHVKNSYAVFCLK